MARTFPRKIKRVVVKVGSSVIASHRGKERSPVLRSLLEQISDLKKQGVDVVLVSSGAIVLGMAEMGVATRPTEVAQLQAFAAIGQAILMRTYSELFKENGVHCAQVLLTWDDFDNRLRFNSARQTFNAILQQKAVPIVNENDTIAADEIKFGDNDRLSALVASLVQADLLMILTDVEGFYEIKDGQPKVLEEIKEITREIEALAGGTSKKHMSRGGMVTKLDAVKIATHANIPCVIAGVDAPAVLQRVIEGERLGTLFVEKEDKLLARKHWISFGAKPKGTIVVDDGAREALLKGGRSLLLPGIVSWDGHFKADDVVIVVDREQQELARGVTNYSVSDLHRATDKKGKKEVIHYDQLVLCQR